MKKYLLLLVTFLTSFLFLTNVKAATGFSISTTDLENIYTTMDNYKNNFIDSSYVNKVEKAIEAFEITEDDYYIILGLEEYNALYCYKWSKTSNAKAYIYAEKNKASSTNYTYLNLVVSKTEESDDIITQYEYYLNLNNLSKTTTNETLTLYSNAYTLYQGTISSSLFTPTSKSMYQMKIIDTNADIYFTNNQNYFYVKTNTNYNTYSYYDTISVCDDEICYLMNDNSLLMDSTKTGSWVVKDYTYENLIDTTELNQVEFSFKIPTDNNTFSFDLELLTQFSDIYLAKPYLEYSDNFGNVTISQIDDFLGERTKVEATNEDGTELYEYSGQFGIDFNEIYELRLVFDVSNYTDDLYIKFTSPIDFDVNYVNSVDVIDNYITIMMNDKYGLYLIPKVLTSDNFSNINLNGKYNIEVRNNYDGSEQYDILKTYIDYVEPNFQYKYTFNNLNYLIYFENNEYNTDKDDSYYITFDTRYYNYAIKELEFDSPIINNPNTGEDIIINPDDSIENEKDLNSFLDYIEKIFDDSVIKDLFNNIYNLFRNSKIGNYLFIVIISSIILYLINAFKK